MVRNKIVKRKAIFEVECNDIFIYLNKDEK